MFIKLIDDFLNKITMYRLVFYCLIFLWLLGLIISFFGVLPFQPLELFISSAVIFIAGIATNIIFEKIFKAPSNPESTYITSLILSLVLGPERSLNGLWLLAITSFVALSSKYLIAINKKHIFNPAAFGMVIAAYALQYYPSWWIGDTSLIWFVAIIGLLITRKLQRFDLVLGFFTVFIITSIGNIQNLQNFFGTIYNLFAYSPALFFAFVMVTEPSTTPPKRLPRIIYGALMAFLIAPFVHIGTIYFSPELALLAGNIFSFAVSPKAKLLLTLKEIKKIATNTYDFVFLPHKKIAYEAGQYMEWTLKHKKYDDRGVRRYFTLASSPTEDTLRLGVKFYENPSTFKKNLLQLNQGGMVVASQLSGDFTLPKDKNKKLIFIAGGIGVTPFRSMVKYLIDKNEKRDIIIFYSVNSYQDIAYKEIFDEAENKLGIKTVYILNDSTHAPAELNYKTGLINEHMISETMKDFKERFFYISGPRAMITSFFFS